jgi:hypothetical protein
MSYSGMNQDEAHSALGDLVEVYGKLKLADANEAETRKKVIDTVLEKILGWHPIQDITYEERVSEDGETSFSDYILRVPPTAVIVEAKRAGAAFHLPSDRTSAKLGGAISEGEVGRAIKQVRDYARKKSIPFAVATNGDAWILFPAVRTDQVTFEDTQAIIFRNLGDIRGRFIEFWEHLSRERVLGGGLESSLLRRSRSHTNRRLIAQMSEPGYRIGRNLIYEHIEPAVLLALSDESLLSNPDSLEACYVKSAERVKFDTRLNMYFADGKPPLDRKAVRVRKSKSSRTFEQTIENTSLHNNRFILLLGAVGTGKTTFLHYTRSVSAASQIDNKIMWFYIDFKRATPAESPRDFIFRELLRLIETDKSFDLGDWDKTIKPAYFEVIDSLKRGTLKPIYDHDKLEFEKNISTKIDADRDKIEPYVARILSYTSKQRPGYLIVDNVDQLENDDYQNDAFIEAQAAARRMNLNVIMALRESTYFKHRESPIFNAFQVDAIYLDPPEIKPVLSRRFAYAKRILKDRKAEINAEHGSRFVIPDLSVFFDIVSQSLLQGDSGYLIEVVSGGDIRRGLELVREFLASAHVSADAILYSYITKEQERTFPTHEVFRGAILGQRKYYREEESLILNVFDSRLGSANLQLLRIRLLAMLSGLASQATFEGLMVENLQSDLHRLGIQALELTTVVDALVRGRLIHTTNRHAVADSSRLLATRFGGFIMKDLIFDFSYLEPCALEASVYDDIFWGKLNLLTAQIQEAPRKQRIPMRIARTKIFIQYIMELDKVWIEMCDKYGLFQEWNRPLYDESATTRLEAQFSGVVERAVRDFKL